MMCRANRGCRVKPGMTNLLKQPRQFSKIGRLYQVMVETRVAASIPLIRTAVARQRDECRGARIAGFLG
jgi:hypothetical protein